LQDDALRLLCAYDWPGNVRELRNTLERAVMLSDSERIDARALAPFIGPLRGQVAFEPPAAVSADATAATAASNDAPQQQWADAMAAFEKRFICDAVRACNGRVTEAATRIGMGRATLYKKIAAYGIDV
jgi:DNA-binding NtrC family response regulator